jgi:hypothetical protein
MSGPSPRVGDDKVAFAAPILLRAAEQISAELKRPGINGTPH